MDFKVTKEKANTYKIDVKVDKEKVNKSISDALMHEREHIKIDGFRIGKAPIDLVKEKIDQGKLNGHALNHLITEVYNTLLKENKFKPIVNPMFDIKSFKEDSDLEATITLIEKPEIKLGDYKKELLKIKKSEIKIDEKTNEIEAINRIILDKINDISNVELSESLVQLETQRLMDGLFDQTARLGITIDQYLEAIKKKIEDIRGENEETARKILKSDFVLSEISTIENILVDNEEIASTIAAVPDEKSREALSKPEQRSYIKAVLIKSKTLEKLKSYLSE